MAGREKYKVDIWYEATTRKGRRSDQGEGPKQNDLPVTKFFVSNLPQGCSSADVMAVLRGFGSIKSIYIARKNDKLGKRFCFVSFVNVRDPDVLENLMKDVWIGSYKLYVVLARFVDGERVVRKGEKQWVPVRNEEEGFDSGKGSSKETHVEETSNTGQGKGDRRSFRDTLLNVDSPKKVPEIVVTAVNKGGMLWEGCGAVGRVSDLKKLSKLRIWLDLLGHAKVGIRYLGGLWVVLLFDSNVCMVDFVRTKEIWRVCFESLERWEGQVIQSDRIAWLKIYGVPLMLYDESLFKDIGSRFGKVVHLPECDEATVDLSCIMIGVLRKTGLRVNEMISVKWKEEVFSVVVEEETGEWVPECIDDCSVYAESAGNVDDGEDVADQDNNMEPAVESGCDLDHVVTGFVPEKEPVESVVDVQNVQQVGGGNIQVDSNEVGIENDVSINRSKKSRGFRKKARAQKSPSPTGQERPKKRAREGEDLFDIDRFIFPINGNEARTNMEVVEEVSVHKEGAASSIVEVVEEVIGFEATETIKLGSVLGVEHFEKFGDSVEKVINEEGFQQVDQ